jgi:hypothetical protein
MFIVATVAYAMAYAAGVVAGATVLFSRREFT